jgi:hypothetical protein
LRKDGLSRGGDGSGTAEIARSPGSERLFSGTVEIKLKAAVRRRARFRCEYCLFPERLSELPFQVDHVIPRKHSGSDSMENLALACFRCNSYKGPNLSGIDVRSAKISRLFNPRLDRLDGTFLAEGAGARRQERDRSRYHRGTPNESLRRSPASTLASRRRSIIRMKQR